jgi:hypothetical protein
MFLHFSIRDITFYLAVERREQTHMRFFIASPLIISVFQLVGEFPSYEGIEFFGGEKNRTETEKGGEREVIGADALLSRCVTYPILVFNKCLAERGVFNKRSI